jgi:GNAT superfamily N-acetyltransferase
MRIEVTEKLDARLLDAAWRLYIEAFDELRSVAVQRHLLYRNEFDDMMRDGRVTKYLSFDAAGNLSGLATYTNEVTAFPLISPEYFARRWPEHFAQKRIWYVGFMAVHPKQRRRGTFDKLVEALYRTATAEHGMVVLDMCRRNEIYGLPHAIESVLGRLTPQVRTKRMDEQSYWLYEFPAA